MAGTTFSAASWDGYDEQSVTNPGSALTDFTLLIDVSTLSSTWKSTVQSDAGDIRCTKGDGTTELAYDLIEWAYNAGAPTGWIRVKWSGTLAASGTQNVRVYVGYSGTAVAYDATETYGSDNAYASHWASFWPDGGGNDRTANARNLSTTGSPTVGGVSGKVGSATSYNGSSQYASSSDATLRGLPHTHDMTMIYWHYNDNNNVDDASSAWDGTADDLVFYTNDAASGSGGIRCYWFKAGGNIFNENGSDLSAAWHQFAFITRGSANHEAYRDGSSVATSTASVTASSFSNAVMLARSGYGQYCSVDLQEFQLHSVALSDDWIAEEYAQANSQSTFWGTWAWTAGGGGGGGRLLDSLLLNGGRLAGRLVG